MKLPREIVFEASRTIDYPGRSQRRMQWCPSCGAHVQMVTAFDAAGLAEVSPYIIQGWAVTGRLHHGATPEGTLLICLKSLSL